MMLLKYDLGIVAWLQQLRLNECNLTMVKSMLLLAYLMLPPVPIIKQIRRFRLLSSIERAAAKSVLFIFSVSPTYRQIHLTK